MIYILFIKWIHLYFNRINLWNTQFSKNHELNLNQHWNLLPNSKIYLVIFSFKKCLFWLIKIFLRKRKWKRFKNYLIKLSKNWIPIVMDCWCLRKKISIRLRLIFWKEFFTAKDPQRTGKIFNWLYKIYQLPFSSKPIGFSFMFFTIYTISCS